jgi:hypothetical protein
MSLCLIKHYTKKTYWYVHVYIYTFFIDKDERIGSRSHRFTPQRKDSCNRRVGGWLGPVAGMGVVVNVIMIRTQNINKLKLKN